MMSVFDTLITPMNYSLIRDSIASFLLNERDKQKQIAKAQNYSDDWIKQNIDFTVFPKKYRVASASDCPCVQIYFDEGNFPPGQQYPQKNQCQASLNVICYAVGLNETCSTTEKIIKTADENADERLDYLLSQVYKTLFSEKGWYLGAEELVKSRQLVGWRRVATPESENEAETILGINLRIQIEFNEPTKVLSGTELKELCIKLKIRNEFINQILKIKGGT